MLEENAGSMFDATFVLDSASRPYLEMLKRNASTQNVFCAVVTIAAILAHIPGANRPSINRYASKSHINGGCPRL